MYIYPYTTYTHIHREGWWVKFISSTKLAISTGTKVNCNKPNTTSISVERNLYVTCGQFSKNLLSSSQGWKDSQRKANQAKVSQMGEQITDQDAHWMFQSCHNFFAQPHETNQMSMKFTGCWTVFQSFLLTLGSGLSSSFAPRNINSIANRAWQHGFLKVLLGAMIFNTRNLMKCF
jgi:hypothetical protein